MFPSESCMQGVCKAQPWAPLAHLLPSSLQEVWAGHPPEVTDSFQQLDSPSICRAGVLVSPETDPHKHMAFYRAPVKTDRRQRSGHCWQEGGWLSRGPEN